MKIGWVSILASVVFVQMGVRVLGADVAGKEIDYPSKSFSKLDTFEALNLEDADKLYLNGDYKGAYAAYKAYSFEFAKSPALPYVLLRMGRCLHKIGKRHAAIKAYQDVVDYFPDSVRYAAAALFYIGQCHGQNGDAAKQTAVWARLVRDDDYVAEPNSGTALVHLAKAMDELKKFDEATEYRWRTAVNFAKINEGAAREARDSVILHYVVRQPNNDNLQEFFKRTNGFGDRSGRGDNPEKDKRYWNRVLDVVVRSKKETACQYWASKMGDKFEDDGRLRIKLFNAQRIYEKDTKAWLARMTKQFEREPTTLKRVVDWVPQFSDPDSQLAFVMKYGKEVVSGATVQESMKLVERMRWNRDKFFDKYLLPTVGGLKNEDRIWLMNRLRYPCGLHAQAQSVLRKVNLNGLSDKQIRDVGMFAANYLPEEDVLRYFAKMKDKLDASKARFDYFGGNFSNQIRNADKALVEVPTLRKSPTYAGQDLSWKEALLWRKTGKYEEAIKAYRAANKQPDSTWAVTDCLVAMKQYGAAIKNVQGLESVKATAPAACLKIADIYKAAGQKGKEVDQLRLVLRRYPKSGQSSQAHQRLESYGVALIGGESNAEE